MASRSRRKTVKRERLRSSVTVSLTGWSGTAELCVEVEAGRRLRVVRLEPGERTARAKPEQALPRRTVAVLRLVCVEHRVVDLDDLGLAVEDHDLVAALEVDDDARIPAEVATLARARVRPEVDGAVCPDAPDRRRGRLAVSARGD